MTQIVDHAMPHDLPANGVGHDVTLARASEPRALDGLIFSVYSESDSVLASPSSVGAQDDCYRWPAKSRVAGWMSS
jgi:hypothetical protein